MDVLKLSLIIVSVLIAMKVAKKLSKAISAIIFFCSILFLTYYFIYG